MGKILAVACTVVSVLFGLSSVYYAVTRPFAVRYYNERNVASVASDTSVPF
jgi:hypothetical protein